MSGCDLACQTKIILNGGNVAGVAGANNDVIRRLKNNAFEQVDGAAIIKLLNRMEDDAVAVQKLLVKGIGYTGETGKMLE